MSSKTTVLIHIYNEEYLLPFWLRHHKDIFDDIVIVDYKSTDKSIEICKKICPNCTIITTRNDCFAAIEVDKEFMDIENSIEGIKMILNVTEFLFFTKPIKEIFSNLTVPISIRVNCFSPYSINNYIVENNLELFGNLLNDDVVFHQDRSPRQLHNFPNGNYTIGRHSTNNRSINTDELYIIWLGFYPMNDELLKRKMQIQQNIPMSDKMRGFGAQHLYDKHKISSINNKNATSGIPIRDLNKKLYKILLSCIEPIPNVPIHINYPELLNDGNWGEDNIILNNDINLLQNTNFDDTGYCILDIQEYNKLLQNLITNEIYKKTNKTFDLEKYHNNISEDEHTSILNSMPYKKNINEEISKFSDYLENIVSTILNEKIKIFNGDLWFRICRPTSIYNNDFNPCHRDVYLEFYRNIVNIYLPVIGSNELSSLNIISGKTLIFYYSMYFMHLAALC